jgi:K+-sensing histidine kinase KdpD
MKLGTIKTVALATSISVLVAGCADLTPGENAAVFGGMAGLAAGSIARAAGASTAESFAIGAATGAIVGITTYIIAKHQATERQRRIAEQRARVYYGRVVAQRRREEQLAARSGKKIAATKHPRYIAVDTERNEKTSPKAKKAVMIWDTQSETVVGNNVYDVQSPPSVGSTARFETYSAEYVGGGG